MPIPSVLVVKDARAPIVEYHHYGTSRPRGGGSCSGLFATLLSSLSLFRNKFRNKFYSVSYAFALIAVVLALFLQLAPNAVEAQTADTIDTITLEASKAEASQSKSVTKKPPAQQQIDNLQEKIERLAKDFKDLSSLAGKLDEGAASSNDAKGNKPWIAIMAMLQERLRVMEHTITDLTARLELLERFGVSKDGAIAQSDDGRGDGSRGLGSASNQFTVAQNFLRARKVEQAIRAFEEFVRQNPTDKRTAEAMFYLGESYSVMQDDKKAISAFLDGYKKNRNGDFAPKLLLRLGQTLAKVKKTKQACRVLKEFKKRFDKADEQLTRIVESEIATNSCGA